MEGTARVILAGIQAEGRHGASPGEQLEVQPFVIDLDAVLAVNGDTLDDTMDYRAMADVARNTVAGSSFQLLESLAEAVARSVFELNAVVEVTATVHKHRAAASLGVEDVSAEVSFQT
jgi:7,8-dihydroneopterin aldolase/epimerase/oxygenase